MLPSRELRSSAILFRLTERSIKRATSRPATASWSGLDRDPRDQSGERDARPDQQPALLLVLTEPLILRDQIVHFAAQPVVQRRELLFLFVDLDRVRGYALELRELVLQRRDIARQTVVRIARAVAIAPHVLQLLVHVFETPFGLCDARGCLLQSDLRNRFVRHVLRLDPSVQPRVGTHVHITRRVVALDHVEESPARQSLVKDPISGRWTASKRYREVVGDPGGLRGDRNDDDGREQDTDSKNDHRGVSAFCVSLRGVVWPPRCRYRIVANT